MTEVKGHVGDPRRTTPERGSASPPRTPPPGGAKFCLDVYLFLFFRKGFYALFLETVTRLHGKAAGLSPSLFCALPRRRAPRCGSHVPWLKFNFLNTFK